MLYDAVRHANLQSVIRYPYPIHIRGIVENDIRIYPRRVALSCAPVRALLRTHRLESTLMQRCTHGSAPVGALPWAQHALCASD